MISMQIYIFSAKNLKVLKLNKSGIINEHQPITTRCCFCIPLENIAKHLGFLFSGGIEKQHRVVMG